MENTDENEFEINPNGVIEGATATTTLDLIPSKSKERYEAVYEYFENWCKTQNVKVLNEDVIFEFFSEKSKNLKSSSLWSQYSMLRSTVMVKKNIDIKFPKVIAFLKKQSVGYRAIQSKVFRRCDVDKFLLEADDDNYLMMKVALVIALAGACRREELCKITVDNIEDKDTILIIKMPSSNIRTERTFIVVGENNIALYKKYLALRSKHTLHRRLFVFYRGGKCTVQPIGVQSFGKIPSKIASFLKLPNPEQYTGHCFRRTSALDDYGSTCKSNSIGFRGYHTKGSSSKQRSDEEGSSSQSNLVPSTLFESKSRNDERDSFLPEDMSENSMEVSSPRPDPLELKFDQSSTTDYFLPSNSADTEEEAYFVNNPSQPLGVVNDAYTKFFLSMADTVRGLPPDLQIIARRNVLHEVTECELTALSRCNGSKNN